MPGFLFPLTPRLLILICVKAAARRLCQAACLESAHALPGKEEP